MEHSSEYTEHCSVYQGHAVRHEKAEPPDGAPSPNLHRPVRADARRNIKTLLETALTVFTKSGVDAPMREIAAHAGVGVGTIYRHFPKRADLIVAVFRHEVDACADAAIALAADHPPGTALTIWVDRYVTLIAAKRGLGAALHSGDPAYETLATYFEDRLSASLGTLLQNAAAAGVIRRGVNANDLLWAIASLCAPTRAGNPARARRMIDLMLDGVRACPITPRP